MQVLEIPNIIGGDALLAAGVQLQGIACFDAVVAINVGPC